MTLAIVMVLGLLIGYRFGATRKAFAITGVVSAVILTAYALLLINAGNATDLSYWPAIMLLLALGAVWLGSQIRARSRSV